MKNYIGFVNDHSGSMKQHKVAAIADYNNNIIAVKEAASREMLDTVVSVVGVGLGNGYATERQVVISNPHVLKPITGWSTVGGTPLYDGIGDMIELFKSLPDYGNQDVSFLVMVTTDGEEVHSRNYSKSRLAMLIDQCNKDGRWTFVMRVPASMSQHQLAGLNLAVDNIQRWDTSSAEGMTKTTAANTAAMDSYFTARSAGRKATTAFYADAKVNLAQLEDISSKVSLYVVPDADNGIEIRPFILRHRTVHLHGSAFYQLTKTESKVGPDKMVLVREPITGKIYAGKKARKMIGLPDDRNARLHPGDLAGYNIFIQSNSINRKLVGGTGVIYWKEIGREFTEADLAYMQPKVAHALPGASASAAGVVKLPDVPVKNAPTKSPIPVTPQFEYFETREAARLHCAREGIVQSKIINRGKSAPAERRWAV